MTNAEWPGWRGSSVERRWKGSKKGLLLYGRKLTWNFIPQALGDSRLFRAGRSLPSQGGSELGVGQQLI